MADLGDFTIVMETPPVIECTVETIAQVQVVEIGEPGAKGDKGDQGDTGSFSGTTSDDLPEGATHRYYTTERAAAKQDVPTKVVLSADSASYNGTGSNFAAGNYPGLDLVFTATGRYRVRGLVNVLLTTLSVNTSIRLEAQSGLVIAGNANDPMGIGVSNTANSQSTLTTGSPTVISGPARSTNTLGNSLGFEVLINVTTIGTLRLNLVFAGSVTGVGLVKAGSYIEAMKL